MRPNFDLIEAQAERGIVEAQAAAEWISESIKAAFAAWPAILAAPDGDAEAIRLDGSDACERVAEALAVWIKESAPRRFADMTATRYSISGVDCSAPGMERLRSQSEFILLAYPGAGESPSDLARQWADDMQSHAQPDGFCWHAAESAIRSYCEDSADYLGGLLAEVEPAPDDGDSDDFEPAPFRLYVRDSYPESES